MEENQEIKEQQPEAEISKPKAGFNKTPLLIAVLVILTGILLVVSFTSRKDGSMPLTNNSDQTAVLGTSLSIGDQREASVSGSAIVDVNLDTATNKVNGVQLEISYNPEEVKINDIVAGEFFNNPLILKKEIDPTKGIITFVMARQLNEEGLEGTGSIAAINFTKVSSGESELSFTPGTIVTAEGGSESILSKTTSGLVSPTSSQ